MVGFLNWFRRCSHASSVYIAGYLTSECFYFLQSETTSEIAQVNLIFSVNAVSTCISRNMLLSNWSPFFFLPSLEQPPCQKKNKKQRERKHAHKPDISLFKFDWVVFEILLCFSSILGCKPDLGQNKVSRVP